MSTEAICDAHQLHVRAPRHPWRVPCTSGCRKRRSRGRFDPVQLLHDRARGGGLRPAADRAHPQSLRHQPQLRRRRAGGRGACLPRRRRRTAAEAAAGAESAMAFTPFKAAEVAGPKRDFVGYGRHVPKVRWPNDARVAISLVLNYEEGSEYSHANGDGRNDGLTEVIYAMDPKYRDLCAESVFEYGSRAGVWRLERLLTELKIPITFYACAVALERNREVAAWLKEAGHEPCSHGWRWEEVWRLSREEESRAHPPRHRLDQGDLRRAPVRLVLPLRTVGEHPRAARRGGRLRLRFRRLQRRPALLRRGEGQAAPRRPLFDDLQRRQVRPLAELRLARRFRRQSQARPRPAVGRGRDPSAHDVDRAASAADRPGEPHPRAARVHRIRAEEGQGLVHPADRHRQLVEPDITRSSRSDRWAESARGGRPRRRNEARRTAREDELRSARIAALNPPFRAFTTVDADGRPRAGRRGRCRAPRTAAGSACSTA